MLRFVELLLPNFYIVFFMPPVSKIRGHLVFEVSVCVCVCLSVRARLKFFKHLKIEQFSSQAFHMWYIPAPCHPHYMCTSPPSKFKVKVICGLGLKFFCSQVKVFQTPPNRTVFIAGLPYLVHTFTMSPPLHVHVPSFQI
jgi:hypothetical protein